MRQRRTLQMPAWSLNTMIIVLFLPRLHVKMMIPAEKKKEISALFLQRNDFGYLKKSVPDSLKITIVQHGPERYQNKSSLFAEKDGRSLSQQWFKKVFINGEIIARKWLLYSPYRQACYCFVCFLFSKEQFSSNFSKEEGFSTSRKLNPRIKNHNTSPSHRVCMREYLNLVV